MIREGLVVAAFACLGACRHEERRALPACSDDVSRNDVMRLQAAARSGSDPCPELAAPKIVLDARGVSVDGLVKVAPADLPAHAPRNVASLFQSFEGRRRLWRQIHPGEKFAPTVDFAAAPDSDGVAGASVLRSVAWAGFTKIHLVSGDVTVDFECVTPRPPGAPEEAEVVRVRATGTMHDLANAVKDALAKPAARGKRQIAFDRS